MPVSLKKMFEYQPHAIYFRGYPGCGFLTSLRHMLGRQAALSEYSDRAGGAKSAYPSFPIQYIHAREVLFRRIESECAEGKMRVEFPDRKYGEISPRHFLSYCNKTHATLTTIKRDLRYARYIPEAQKARQRLKCFDRDLNSALEALARMQEHRFFSVDTQTGVMVPIDNMPDKRKSRKYIHEEADDDSNMRALLKETRVGLGCATVRLIRQGITDFRTRILDYAKNEFEFSGEDNLRGLFERVALPFRIAKWYRDFLERYEASLVFSGTIFPGESYPSVYAKFGDHYDIKNLFPPSLIGDTEQYETPIDFKTKSNDRLFLLSGLHSGGKSFFLENLVLLEMLAQIPLPQFADHVTLPLHKRLFYYRNSQNSNRMGDGKALSEVKSLYNVIEQLGVGDAFFLDEFSDAMSPEIATWIIPKLMGKIASTGATAFISTHRTHDYDALKKRGWRIMTPGYKREKGLIVPSRKIVRGIPDAKVNLAFIMQQCKQLGVFGRKKRH